MRCPSSARGIYNFHAGRGVCFVAGHFVLVFVFISHLLKGKLDKRILLGILIIIIFFNLKTHLSLLFTPRFILSRAFCSLHLRSSFCPFIFAVAAFSLTAFLRAELETNWFF